MLSTACPKNYIRDEETGFCKFSCEFCKDPNAEYNKCGSRCKEGTCKNPQGLSQICPKICEIGCFCKKGFVKNSSGKCVLPKTCPIPSKIQLNLVERLLFHLIIFLRMSIKWSIYV